MDQHAQSNKVHRAPRVGKTNKKHEKGKNPKAFAPASGQRAIKSVRRNVELDQNRLHVPAIDRTFGGYGGGNGQSSTIGSIAQDDQGPPPVIVAVIGPPGVGKSTLIRSLVRRYTKTTLPDIKGPLTVVTAKQRRLTLIECPNEIGAIVDVSKIADLVLLVIDGSFGFEMETFECLSALNSHGMPKLIAVLTHLDLIKKPAALKEQKKKLKQRFWTELYDGAKLFYLSGVINGRYPDREILNLSRFISTAKFRPLIFRNSHSYMLADRFEDLTPASTVRQNPKCSRKVAVWGYLRGIPLRAPAPGSSIRIHVPGSGTDALDITKIIPLPDPCPLPTKDSEKRRKLSDKHRIVHAPMTGSVGTGVVFDGDRVWINTAGTFTKNSEESVERDDDYDEMRGEGEQMVLDLQDAKTTLNDGIAQSQIRLFSSSQAPLSAKQDYVDDYFDSEENEEDEEEDDDEEDEEEEEEDNEGVENSSKSLRKGRKAFSSLNDGTSMNEEEVAYADSDSDFELDDDDDEELVDKEDNDNEEVVEDEEEEEYEYDDDDDENEGPRWKDNMIEHAHKVFNSKPKKQDMMKLIYSTNLTPEEIINQGREERQVETIREYDDDLFRLVNRTDNSSSTREQFRTTTALSELDKWQGEEVLDSIRKFFITGKKSESNEEGSDNEDIEMDGSDVEGDFEDLETGEQHIAKKDFSEGDNEADDIDEDTRMKELASKKEELKRKFDEMYDGGSDEDGKEDYYTQQKTEMAKRLEATREEFANDDMETRAAVEGYRPGTYVRMEISDFPCEIVENFDPRQPLLIGALLAHEETFGFIQVRLKKHRWHSKILKTNDPLIISAGWRRFQTTPIYSLDDGTRNRMLKYTPEHLHCIATFWGPISAPNTGLCAFNSMGSEISSFRVSATGVVLSGEGSSRIVKKLKLTGVPYKIYKNTAFIKDMFNSNLEVAKFEGANIRTVSGIRGQVKKAVSKPEGGYRATFEDKILMSDIVFLRAWYMVKPRKYYNPMASLLLQDKSSWKGMRLTGQVRRDEDIKTPNQVNSIYKPITRETRRFNKLQVPRKLQAALPFGSKPKIQQPAKKQTYMQKRAVLMAPEERKTLGILAQMQTVQREKASKRKEKKAEKRKEHLKAVAKDEERRADKAKELRREHFRNEARKKSKK